MMRPEKKGVEVGEKDCLSKEIESLCSTELIPERHCGATQHDRASGLHAEGRGGHPALQPEPHFPSQSSAEPLLFLCKLQVSLIMLYTDFNECLPRFWPRPRLSFLMEKQLQ